MGAAQNHCVHRNLGEGIQLFQQELLQPVAAEFSPLHKIHQTAAGYRHNLRLLPEVVPQVKKLLFLQGHSCGHDQNAAAGMAFHRRLQGRLRTDDGDFGIPFPQHCGRCGGGRIAGNDDGLCPLLQQMFRRSLTQLPNLFQRTGSIGCMERIPKIEIVLAG